MRTVLIVQARMASTRLPGKVLLDLGGRPMLAQQLSRLRRSVRASDLVVATSVSPADDPVAELALHEQVGCVRGSEVDVLGRFVRAAMSSGAEAVVRTTADCPLIDPDIVDRVIAELLEHRGDCDYASNVLRRTYPRGLDVEAMFLDVLLRLDRLATTAQQREHVTALLRGERRDLFQCRSVEDSRDNSDLRWTVDTPEDFAVIDAVFRELDLGRRSVTYPELLDYVRSRPRLCRTDSPSDTWDPVRVRRPPER